MSAALNRRDEGCASDLAFDRWLLGELPGSDEGRKLEQHVRGCPSCGARLKALRSLYQTAPVAAGIAKPVKAAKPPRIDPATDGVMQVAILRDGLLVGTQVFTPGHYAVGSADDCDLALDDLEAAHAQLYFRAGHTAVESSGAPLFVNGFPMKCATVRPIDEIGVGPYVLRLRIIQSRWEPALKVVPPPPPTPPVSSELSELGRTEPSRRRVQSEPEPQTELLTTPAAKVPRGLPIQLKAQLLWGQSILETAAFDGPLTPNAFDRWGVEPLRRHLLAEPVLNPAFRVHVPEGLDGARGDVELQLGESLRLEHEGLTLLLSVTEAPKKAPSASWRQLPWTVMSMCALLALAFAMFATFAPEPGDSESAFTAKPPVSIRALIEPPVKPTPVTVAVADPVKTPVRTHHEPPPHVRPPPPPDRHGMGGLPQLLKKLDSAGWKAIADKSVDVPMGHLKPAGPTVGIATGGSIGNTLGLITNHPIGIGASGLIGAGKMGHGNLGHVNVQGTVGHVTMHDVRGDGATIDKQSIADAINKHLHEISECYESSMMREGAFGGKLTLEWSIGPGGHVGFVRVANATVKSASVGTCIMGKLKLWGFPSPRGPGSVTVSYPFLFHSSDFN